MDEKADSKGEDLHCDDLLTFIKEKCEEFQRTEYHSFKEFINDDYRYRKGIFEHPGVYVIYKDDSPIYVGSAGKGKHHLGIRIHDLFWDYKKKTGERRYYHPLTEKLSKHKSLNEVRRFYIEECRLRVLKTDTVRQARLMEAFLIELLNPKYNSE